MSAAPDLMTRIATLEQERNEARAKVARVEALGRNWLRLAGAAMDAEVREWTGAAGRSVLAAINPPAPLLNPECVAEKCRNCDGTALDEQHDEIVQCEHGCHAFERRAEIRE